MTYKSIAKNFAEKTEEHRDVAERFILLALEAIASSDFDDTLTYLQAATKRSISAKVSDEKSALMRKVAGREE